jgi:hypothetical protein
VIVGVIIEKNMAFIFQVSTKTMHIVYVKIHIHAMFSIKNLIPLRDLNKGLCFRGECDIHCATLSLQVTGGLIYDVIVEPPSMGSTTDEHGHSRPVAFMQYRINGQYIMEGQLLFLLSAPPPASRACLNLNLTFANRPKESHCTKKFVCAVAPTRPL